jgi:PAS domain-containing protein
VGRLELRRFATQPQGVWFHKEEREGFRPPLSRIAGLSPRLYGLVTSPRLPGLLIPEPEGQHLPPALHMDRRQTIEVLAHAANATLVLTLIADRHRTGPMWHGPCSIPDVAANGPAQLSRPETEATQLRRGGTDIKMKHAGMHELFDYWHRRRGRRRAPARSNIDAADIRHFPIVV